MAKVRQTENSLEITEFLTSKVTTMGNVTEVITMQKKSMGCPCLKIDKDHYCDLRTGEYLEYEHIENRSGSLRSIRNSLAKIRALINTNVVEPDNCRWVTFTYAENVIDKKQLYHDFRKFWGRFCYWCKIQEVSKPEYINVVEPQGRGAWHIHAFFIWDEKAPFIPNDPDTYRLMNIPIEKQTGTMSELWGLGITKTKQLIDVDNPGAYFSAYLGDLPIEDYDLSPSEWQQAYSATGVVEEKEFSDEQGFLKTKKFIKGGRLFMYPPGMNIVRSSSGIKEPEVEVIPYFEARKKVSAATETFSRTYEILDDSETVINVISKSYYNSKRKG